MNGLRNLIFIIIILAGLIALAYMYSTTDIIADSIYNIINSDNPNSISTQAHTSYINMREFMYKSITLVIVPYLLFLCFTSSFINSNQNMITYIIQVVAVLMATPICLYMFSELLTQFFSVSIINTAYLSMQYFNNFLFILVINMLLAIASFIFVRKSSLEVLA